MKILVISDSHGRRDLVELCVRQHPDAEVVLHLGDLWTDVKHMPELFPDRRFVYVRGNCDFENEVPPVQCVTVENVTIYLTHGHQQGVKYGLAALMSHARSKGAQICLYGHTHVPYNKYHDGLYVMNPGSLVYPRDSSVKSYGLIEICPQGIMTNVAAFKPNLRGF